jgi:hypothetical protein
MSHNQKAMIEAHKAGCDFAKRTIGEIDATKNALIIAEGLDSQDEQDAFLGGFHGERQRIARRNATR